LIVWLKANLWFAPSPFGVIKKYPGDTRVFFVRSKHCQFDALCHTVSPSGVAENATIHRERKLGLWVIPLYLNGILNIGGEVFYAYIGFFIGEVVMAK
jgi:hypothetical protein